MVLHRLFDTLPGYIQHPEKRIVNPFLPRGKAPPLALLLSNPHVTAHPHYAFLKSWTDKEAAYELRDETVAAFPFSAIRVNETLLGCFETGRWDSTNKHMINHVIDDLVPNLSPGT